MGDVMEIVKSSSISKILNVLSKHDEVVIMSGAEYNGLVETLYLKSIPGVEESIISGINAPKSEFVEFKWQN
jgi:PHD/YefM family antitoxin component YafN of YafNO toxin-antitoxin module